MMITTENVQMNNHASYNEDALDNLEQRLLFVRPLNKSTIEKYG